MYEYQCTACSERTDKLLPYDRIDAPGPCPACAGELRRVWSRVGVRLDGWGFAGNDALVADRPGRGDFRAVRERAERIADTGT